MPPTLSNLVAQHPYPDFQKWWPLGDSFVSMMTDAILGQWRKLAKSADDLAPVQAIVDKYVPLVYARRARPNMAAEFSRARHLDSVLSGEFDALSFAFFHTAFDSLAVQHRGEALRLARRQFTERVGARFFNLLAGRLALDLPPALNTERDLVRLATAVQRIGEFLLAQGYLRSHFAFRFDVSTSRAGRAVDQRQSAFLGALASGATAYALYEMGHPVILPSAVYLYQIVGEAQHHSSRTIEELFARVGCQARETDDFDPSSDPPQFVVELWEIRRRA